MIQITSDPAPDWYPNWSPDETKVTFYSYRSGNRDVWVMPLSGGPVLQLTDGAATGASSWSPKWSPNGREILYYRMSEHEGGFWVMPSDGGLGRLVEGGDFATFSIWSPDGQVTYKKGVEGQLWRVPAEGGDPELLVEESVGAAEWSGDGRRLFFFKRGVASRAIHVNRGRYPGNAGVRRW